MADEKKKDEREEKLRGRSATEIRENDDLRQAAAELAEERGREKVEARADPDVTERYAGGTAGGASESQQPPGSVRTLAGTGPVEDATFPEGSSVAMGVVPRPALGVNPGASYADGEEAEQERLEVAEKEGGQVPPGQTHPAQQESGSGKSGSGKK
jgi:hypothetical protein